MANEGLIQNFVDALDEAGDINIFLEVTAPGGGQISLNGQQVDTGDLLATADGLITYVGARNGRASDVQKPAADISAGVTLALRNHTSMTLLLNAAAAVDVTVEVSPNGGTDTYEIPESPIQFAAAGDDVVRITYDVNWIRLTGSNTTAVLAQIRELI